eukprot:CAMPEP_0181471350 /NCGR_PEP_ID=MMETSP1110-20121109/39029_1 /TAXON_ID=174948 /ORGANISM="Symbiodinium sp., Strain CCMP421" /LENGTH=105 /DNA_ID=CAMNT_0023596365 /DNA_START=209 /DNA_END=526 /DNA_ORIENTATION=-
MGQPLPVRLAGHNPVCATLRALIVQLPHLRCVEVIQGHALAEAVARYLTGNEAAVSWHRSPCADAMPPVIVVHRDGLSQRLITSQLAAHGAVQGSRIEGASCLPP